MLQVTEAAAEVLETMREQAGAPAEAGVRIQLVQGDDGQNSIGLAFAEQPQGSDEITEQSGVKVFIQQELAPTLEQAVLDARSTEQGAQLVVRQ